MVELQKIMDINTSRANLNLYKLVENKDEELFNILEAARDKWWKMKYNEYLSSILKK